MSNAREIVQIDISALVLERCYQAREHMDEVVVDGYAEVLIESGRWTFPPIGVVQKIVTDGHHRLAAVNRVINSPETPPELKKSLRSIPCEPVKVDPACKDVRDLALRHALAANHTHGLARSWADKRRAVELALKAWPDESDREIAKLTGTSHPFVAKMRDQAQVETLPLQSVEEPSSNGTRVETLPPSEILDTHSEPPTGNDPSAGTVEMDSNHASSTKRREGFSTSRIESAQQTKPTSANRKRVKVAPAIGLVERAQNALADTNKACSEASRRGGVGTEADRHEIRYHLKKVDAKLADWMNQAEGLPR